jgi:hypothetical protein
MYCPNCSTKISSEQKFCRTCGLGLEKIVQSLSEQLPTRLDETVLARKNKLERLGITASTIFGLGVFGLLLYGVGYKLMLTQGKILAGLGIIGFIVLIASGMGSVILFAKADELKEASGKAQLQKPNELQENQSTANLLTEAQLQPAPTVTERRTELLFAERNNVQR